MHAARLLAVKLFLFCSKKFTARGAWMLRRVQVPWIGPKWQVAAGFGLLKGGRADWMVEKCTELGAHSVCPLVSHHVHAAGGGPPVSIRTLIATVLHERYGPHWCTCAPHRLHKSPLPRKGASLFAQRGSFPLTCIVAGPDLDTDLRNWSLVSSPSLRCSFISVALHATLDAYCRVILLSRQQAGVCFGGDFCTALCLLAA